MPPAMIPIGTISGVFDKAFRLPTVTAFNRLEASPRAADFTRSLRAEVRDARTSSRGGR